MRRDEQQNSGPVDVYFEPAAPRRLWGSRLIALALLVLFAAAGVALTQLAGDDEPNATEDPAPDAEVDETPDPEDEPEEVADDEETPDVVTDLEPVALEVDVAGRFTGIDSLQFPLQVSPDDGLVDGQAVQLMADGFAPNITVAAVQCAGIEGEPRGEGSCDVGNYVLHHANENGAVNAPFAVRRFISNASGEVDCADPGEQRCTIVVADINDYDNSALAQVWFDPAVDGARAPTITLDRLDDLENGDTVVVTGTNFVPDEPVVVGQCVIGGSWSIFNCWIDDHLVGETIADADGGFMIEVQVARTVSAGGDCFGSPYGCRIAARTATEAFDLGDGTAANPVRIWFDGSELPADPGSSTAFALNPDRDLQDGETVVIRLANIQQSPCVDESYRDTIQDVGLAQEEVEAACLRILVESGTILVAQCVDLAAGEEYCGETIEVELADGVAEATVSLQRVFVRESGEAVDCAEIGRQCEIRLWGAVSGHVPLRFAAD